MIDYKESDFKEYIIKPNNSLSWGGNKVFFYLILSISAIIVFGFAMTGMWLIIPFAGLEMILLGLCLAFVCMKNSQYELVQIEENMVSVSLINNGNKKVFKCNRHWAKFILNKPYLNGYPHKLILRSSGKEIEIGALLTDKERIELSAMLQKI